MRDGMRYGFYKDFINQKVYINFDFDTFSVIKEYLESRRVDELRTIEKTLEDVSDEYKELRFDDYSRLIYNKEKAGVIIQYPNYEEPDDEDLGDEDIDDEEARQFVSYEGFYKLIVKYNYIYDLILIDKTPRDISPKAQKIIDEALAKHVQELSIKKCSLWVPDEVRERMGNVEELAYEILERII